MRSASIAQRILSEMGVLQPSVPNPKYKSKMFLLRKTPLMRYRRIAVVCGVIVSPAVHRCAGRENVHRKSLS